MSAGEQLGAAVVVDGAVGHRGAAEYGPLQPGALHVRELEVCPCEIGSAEVGAEERAADDDGIYQDGVTQIGRLEAGLGQIGPGQVGAPEVSTGQVGARPAGMARDLDGAQVSSAQVCSWALGAGAYLAVADQVRQRLGRGFWRSGSGSGVDSPMMTLLMNGVAVASDEASGPMWTRCRRTYTPPTAPSRRASRPAR